MSCSAFVHFLTPTYVQGHNRSRNFKRGVVSRRPKKLQPVFECSRKVQLAMHKLYRLFIIVNFIHFYKLFPFHARLGRVILVCLLIFFNLNYLWVANHIVNNICDQSCKNRACGTTFGDHVGQTCMTTFSKFLDSYLFFWSLMTMKFLNPF